MAASVGISRATADVVIAGAGIMGLHTAYQLHRRLPTARIVVLERARDLGQGSSGYSSAMLRCFYSSDGMSRLAAEGLVVHRNWGDYLRLKDPVARLSQVPVLWITGQDTASTAAAAVARLTAVGHQPSALSAAEVETRFPAIKVHPSAAVGRDEPAYLCEEDTGYFDPSGALRDLARACAATGVIDLRLRTEAAAVDCDAAGRAIGVHLANGEYIASGAVVNTGGPWCQALNASAGLKLPWNIAPVRIQVLHKTVPGLGTPAGGAFAALPAVCDIEHGVYFRPQLASGQILVSTVRPEEEREVVADADDFNRAADPEMRQRYLSVLHERMPSLEPRGPVSHYSALYTANMDDGHPVIGATSVPGYFIANGFSGHGFKIAPVSGALLAQAITGLTTPEYDTSSDAAFLSPMRQPLGDNKGVLG